MRKIFLTLALAGVAVAAVAQGEAKIQKGPYLTNEFFDNWFLGIGGGANISFGGPDRELDFGDRIAPNLNVQLGKWITPSVGLRGVYQGLGVKGGVNNGRNKVDYDLMNVHADALWNLSSAIGGYRENRFWEFIPFGGFGLAQGKDGGHKVNHFGLNGGLINKIHITPAWNVNLEFSGLITDRSFTGEDRKDYILGTSIGVAYNFNRRGFERPKYDEYTNKIENLEINLSAANAKAGRLESDLTASQARVRQISEELTTAKSRPVAPASAAVMPEIAIFFPIGSAVLSEKESINIGYLAKALKESGSSISVTGSADSATGSAKFNAALSKKRAEAVKAALVKAGVDASKVTVSEKIDAINKAKPVLNRVVITK